MPKNKSARLLSVRTKLHTKNRENTFLLISMCIALTVLSGFFPISETDASKNIRKTLYTSSQALSSTLLQNKQETPQDFMVMQVGIGEQKIALTPTLPPQTVAATWGKATQIDEHTWTMKLQSDSRMATAQEIFTALNTYRREKGRGTLTWDDNLASYARDRAVFFTSSGKLDGHAGFQAYMDNDGFGKLGFSSLGENSSYGYFLEGVHLIEWVYAGDAPHDNNQLHSEWTHVGIGVNETATNLIFGGLKR